MALDGLRFFQGWLNDAAVKCGGKQVDDLSMECVTNFLSESLVEDGITCITGSLR